MIALARVKIGYHKDGFGLVGGGDRDDGIHWRDTVKRNKFLSIVGSR